MVKKSLFGSLRECADTHRALKESCGRGTQDENESCTKALKEMFGGTPETEAVILKLFGEAVKSLGEMKARVVQTQEAIHQRLSAALPEEIEAREKVQAFADKVEALFAGVLNQVDVCVKELSVDVQAEAPATSQDNPPATSQDNPPATSQDNPPATSQDNPQGV